MGLRWNLDDFGWEMEENWMKLYVFLRKTKIGELGMR